MKLDDAAYQKICEIIDCAKIHGDLDTDVYAGRIASVVNTAVPCIERTFFGGSEEVTFDRFARVVVQDEDEAAAIARRMLDGIDPYPFFNTPDSGAEPEFYEEFTVCDPVALRAQLANF